MMNIILKCTKTKNYIQSDDNKKELNLTKFILERGLPLKNIKKISQLSSFHPTVK